MPIVRFTDRDLRRGEVPDPDWYRVYIDEIDADGTLSKDGKSTNYNAEATILFNGETGGIKFKGVPITWNFNSKALGFSKGLFLALGLEVKANEGYRLEACAGREVDMYIGQKPYEGRIVVKVDHKYRTPKSEVVATDSMDT